MDWINAAGGLSTAFDITTKGIMHAVFERNEYWRLRDDKGKPPGLLGWWPSRAVTFLENHDTVRAGLRSWEVWVAHSLQPHMHHKRGPSPGQER